MVHIYSEILFSHKKDEIVPFVVTWTDLEILILSEISQRMKSNMTLLTCEILKKKGTYLQNRNRPTETENKLTVIKGERCEARDKLGGWDLPISYYI